MTSIYRCYILFDYRQPNLVLQGPSGPDPTTRGFSKCWQRPISLRSLSVSLTFGQGRKASYGPLLDSPRPNECRGALQSLCNAFKLHLLVSSRGNSEGMILHYVKVQ